jgi:ribosomal protein S12 methylthiotransferase
LTDNPTGFAMVSLGCPKNLVDSEYICEQLIKAGYTLKADAQAAQLVIVNTCAFLTSAVEESIQTILEYLAHGKTVVCAGCLVSRYGQELLAELPEVRIFAGPGSYTLLDRALVGTERYLQPRFDSVVQRTFCSTGASAYVKLSEGCSNHCHYCLIPGLRGELVSKPYASVLDECRDLVRHGVKELILVGQDIGSYGIDLGIEDGLIRLLTSLTELEGVAWVRPMYIHPVAVSKALIETISNNPCICNYIEMPIQHVADTVLAAMGRRGGAHAVHKALDLLKQAGIWIRTTLMVGHPGEDESAFQELEHCVADGCFDSLGAFVYSPEPGTVSATLPQIDTEHANQRLERIMSLQKKVSRRKLKTFIGQRLPVLLEGYHSETELLLQGRSVFQAPEVDGQVLINDGSAPFGTIVTVEIEDTLDYDLIGRIL